jgi:hypothetical protein
MYKKVILEFQSQRPPRPRIIGQQAQVIRTVKEYSVARENSTVTTMSLANTVLNFFTASHVSIGKVRYLCQCCQGGKLNGRKAAGQRGLEFLHSSGLPEARSQQSHAEAEGGCAKLFVSDDRRVREHHTQRNVLVW